jgi:hypothetical protein
MVPEFSKIITHPGGAHKDDFLACCFLLHWNPVVIERRDPTDDEIAAKNTAVVDIGHVHDPESGNFDHHQFPREHVPTCSLSLVLQAYDLYDDARLFCEWLDTLEWFDSRGAVSTAKHLDMSFEALRALNSPIDVTLLRMFSSERVVEPGSVLWEIMQTIGREQVAYLKKMHDRMDTIANTSQTWQISDNSGKAANVLFMPRSEPLPEEPSLGLSLFIEQQSEDYVGLVYPDRRGKGYGLSRFNDHPFFDFCRIEKEEDVHFAHSRGFLAKTTATEVSRLKALLQRAVV